MKYVSLFAGIGGFEKALNDLGHTCVWANEWDKYAVQTYEKNFGHKPDTRDITTVRADEIPDHELLVGGFPCQSFSVAGLRKGFDDTRGTLFFDIARVVEKKRPRYILLENVKGLLSHDKGRTFKIILSKLTELGYDLQSMVLNSKNFGVPQNRERVFIVGYLRGERRPEVFPITKEDGRYLESKKIYPMELQSQTQFGKTTGQSILSKSNVSINSSNSKQQGQRITQRFPLKFLNRNQRKIEGDYSFTVDGANTGGVVVGQFVGDRDNRSWSETKIVPTLQANAQSKAPIVLPMIRRLTPIECERLQGFPDNWTQGVSDTQRYKQLGNAVTVNVVSEIVKRMFPS